MAFNVEVRVVPRRGILDPQGKAVQGALSTLGFGGVGEVHVGRLVRLEIDAPTAEEAEERAISMCRQLLANPVTEDFDVQVLEGAGSAR
jgi:phosphoribosylformylglycinamidine synthase PurS subunit